MAKNLRFVCICAPVLVASLVTVVQLNSCHTLPLEAEDRRYLDLNEVGITVLIGPDDKATIILDIRQDFRDGVSLIRYAMDEHDLVLKSPKQTRSVYVGAQLQLKKSHIVHLPDSVRLVIDCQKPM